MSTSEQKYAALKRFEGNVPYLYKDTKGNITAGVGFLIRSLADAQRLEWDLPGQVRLDYVAVQAAGSSHEFPAEHFRGLTRARLLPDGIDREIARRVQKLPTWALSLPASVRDALIDITYNTGPITSARWPKMIAALAARDWHTAAHESNRPDVGKERNAWTAAQILAAE